MGTLVHAKEHPPTHRSYDLKSRIEEDVFIALAVNPHTVFAYWDITPVTQSLLARHFATPWSEMRLGLRIMDVTGLWMEPFPLDVSRIHGQRDIDTPPHARRWYVTELHDGRDYVLDLGTWSEGGQHFFTILRSNRAHTPCVYAARTAEKVRPLQAKAVSANDWQTRFTGYSLEG